MMGNPASSEDFLNRQIRNKPLRIKGAEDAIPAQFVAPRVFRMPRGKLALDSIAVMPIIPPKRSAGGIEYAGRSRQAEAALTTVGQVLQVGPLAYTTVTRDGLDFSKAVRANVGDWVIYTKSAGQIVLLRDDGPQEKDYDAKVDSPRFLILSDADIKFVFESKEEAMLVWSWTR